MPDTPVPISVRGGRVEPERLHWYHNLNGSEVLQCECNGGQLVVTPLASRGALATDASLTTIQILLKKQTVDA